MRARPSFLASCRSAVGWSGMQCVRSKRAPVATSPSIGTGAFAWKSGWNFMDRLPRRGGRPFRNACWPRGMDNASRALQRPGRCAQCSSPVVSCQPSTTCGSKLRDIRPLAKRVECKSIGDPNRCLLPADLLTPARCGRVAQFESGVTSVASGERQKTRRPPDAWRPARYMTPRP